MSSNSIIKKAKLNEWASRISDQKASGLSVSNWCRQNKISQDKFIGISECHCHQCVTHAVGSHEPFHRAIP